MKYAPISTATDKKIIPTIRLLLAYFADKYFLELRLSGSINKRSTDPNISKKPYPLLDINKCLYAININPTKSFSTNVVNYVLILLLTPWLNAFDIGVLTQVVRYLSLLKGSELKIC